jgi:hypothetical protein
VGPTCEPTGERERRGVRRASSWDEKRERLREGEGVVRRPAVAAAKEKKEREIRWAEGKLGLQLSLEKEERRERF